MIDALKDTLELMRYAGVRVLPIAKAVLKETKGPGAGCEGCPRFKADELFRPFNGEGKKDALVAFVLGLPTKDGDKGVFDGAGGEQLSRIIRWMAGQAKNPGFKGVEDAYVTYAVKCAGAGNAEEAEGRCRPILEKELQDLKPRNIVLMGRDALSLISPSTGAVDYKALRGALHIYGEMKCLPTRGLDEMLENPAIKKEVQRDLELLIGELRRDAHASE